MKGCSPSLGAVVLMALMMSLILLPGAAKGTVIFHNTGTTSGWDSINQEHEGVVSQVSNIVYSGTTAIKAQQMYDSSYTGRYHSEVVKHGVYSLGQSGFYGFAFRLQSDWQFTNQTYNIAQFIADFSDYGCDGYIPTTLVWLLNNQIYTRVKFGQVCAQPAKSFGPLGTITAGKWHKVEIQASWQSSNTGYYKLWLDGTKVLEQDNIATTLPDPRPFQFRAGLYCNSWHDQGYLEGSQPFHQVWYDQIGAGTTFAEADPDQWTS